MIKTPTFFPAAPNGYLDGDAEDGRLHHGQFWRRGLNLRGEAVSELKRAGELHNSARCPCCAAVIRDARRGRYSQRRGQKTGRAHLSHCPGNIINTAPGLRQIPLEWINLRNDKLPRKVRRLDQGAQVR